MQKRRKVEEQCPVPVSVVVFLLASFIPERKEQSINQMMGGLGDYNSIPEKGEQNNKEKKQ